MPSALPPGPYTWDAARAEYRDGRGRPVPARTVRAAVEQAIAGAQAEIRGLVQRLAGGGLDLLPWQLGMADVIRALHTASAAAGKGGWEAMTPADWGRVGYLTKTQYGYLANFAAEIAAGTVDLGQLDQVMRRAESYGAAARLTYSQAAREAADASELSEERNRLGAADHCGDCLGATAAGWVPIGTLALPGSRVCGPHCQCDMEYR